MRHQKVGRKFGREKGQRRAFFKSLAAALVMHGKIKTTLPRAKSLRPYVERLVTYAKIGDKSLALRRVGAVLPKVASKKLVSVIAPKYEERKGGYTRVIKLGRRTGDAAHMAYIEFV
ncbi:MAG: 50S ribosomal protein L17 [Candidatus Giovannonibacteria bacterium GW2011_GWA2_44_13b]|uniref:Large ribosomal subunit protein bL17 n=2 Tax=Candidatus Giovannoniibacteriota TaxID=1752738 RepID=A0A0G1K292_9BACT|nr:MAG: 50S ribosomal protein L17 [Candidatus Giovannonibacteria bacterium GW2011_GWA2_44_13b]OGF81489.1 MAG: 50S ribosomal protein L17 [Candidatus Giovannonibacteria bacterium RIFCSPLOWO2_01_FULL_44_16]